MSKRRPKRKSDKGGGEGGAPRGPDKPTPEDEVPERPDVADPAPGEADAAADDPRWDDPLFRGRRLF